MLKVFALLALAGLELWASEQAFESEYGHRYANENYATVYAGGYSQRAVNDGQISIKEEVLEGKNRLQKILKALEFKKKVQIAFYRAWGVSCAVLDLATDITGVYALAGEGLEEEVRDRLMWISSLCFLGSGITNLGFTVADRIIKYRLSGKERPRSKQSPNRCGRRFELGDALPIVCSTAFCAAGVLDYLHGYGPVMPVYALRAVAYGSYSADLLDPLLGIIYKFYEYIAGCRKIAVASSHEETGEASENMVRQLIKGLGRKREKQIIATAKTAWIEKYGIPDHLEFLQCLAFLGASVFGLKQYISGDGEKDLIVPYGLWLAGDGLGILFKAFMKLRWRYLIRQQGNEPFMFTQSSVIGMINSEAVTYRRDYYGILAVARLTRLMRTTKLMKSDPSDIVGVEDVLIENNGDTSSLKENIGNAVTDTAE